MVLVAVLTPSITLALLVVVIVVVPHHDLARLIVVLGLGIGAVVVGLVWRKESAGGVLSDGDDPELFAILDRLCALADISRPVVVLSEQSQPNSWVTHIPGSTPRLHVTRRLREVLTLDELQAVLGHELAHIANRDALVMTMVGSPASIMRGTGCAAGPAGGFIWAIGTLSEFGVTILSRYRELAADAGAAAITGRPSALASALLKVSNSLQQIPEKDLRAAAALNVFNLVATPPRSRLARGVPLVARITSTHPSLQARLDALHELERAQQLPRV